MDSPQGLVRNLGDARVVVAGAGVAGASAVRFLCAQGAQVTVVDARSEATSPLVQLGAIATSEADLLADPTWVDRCDVVVTSPGFRPTNPMLSAAAAAGIPVWGEVELAWHVDQSGILGPSRTWLVVTGTNGKTTTTSMTEAIVARAGRSVVACGNIGLPVLDAMQQTPRIDVLAVEASSFQLHWAPSIRPDAGVVLNVAEDHLDWHGSMAAYADDKAIALRGSVALVGRDDRVAAGLTATHAFTLDEPVAGELGIVDGILYDRAFADDLPLVDADALSPPGPPGQYDALAASGLCRAIGIGANDIREALADFQVGAHRSELVTTVDGVAFIDDSKATNPHAAQASIVAHDSVIWVAGGQLKGASVDELVTAVGDRLVGAVVLGVDRDEIVDALARHAPDVPVVSVFTGHDGRVMTSSTRTGLQVAPTSATDADAIMAQAVRQAWAIREQSDVTPAAVLLAPAAASLDMFAGYGARGTAFAAAAHELATGEVAQ